MAENPDAPITRITSLEINADPSSPSSVFAPAVLTTAEINAIPLDDLRAGGIVYNINVGSLQTYTINGWENIAVSGGGTDIFDNITVNNTATINTLNVTGNGNINAYTSTLNIDTINAQEINVTNPLNATITTQYLTVNSTATTTNLHATNQIDAGSIAGYITNPPSIAVGPAAGAGASASITGSQISGRFTLTIGTGPVGLELAVISLDASIFATTNFGVCISPAEYHTALDAPLAGIYAVATSSGYPCQFTLYVAPDVPVLNPGSVYTWNYIVIGCN